MNNDITQALQQCDKIESLSHNMGDTYNATTDYVGGMQLTTFQQLTMALVAIYRQQSKELITLRQTLKPSKDGTA